MPDDRVGALSISASCAAIICSRAAPGSRLPITKKASQGGVGIRNRDAHTQMFQQHLRGRMRRTGPGGDDTEPKVSVMSRGRLTPPFAT